MGKIVNAERELVSNLARTMAPRSVKRRIRELEDHAMESGEDGARGESFFHFHQSFTFSNSLIDFFKDQIGSTFSGSALSPLNCI